MTLQESGQFCEAIQEAEMEKSYERIRIMSALAVDINSYYAQFKDKKNKHLPMSELFPDAFTVAFTEPTAQENLHSEVMTWLLFLDKTDYVAERGGGN